MPDILHDFPIRASAARVFEACTSPRGLDAWWTLASDGQPSLGTSYMLDFGPGYRWRALVTACESDRSFELQLTDAMPDWLGTRVRLILAERDGVTTVRFAHLGWAEASEHFRTSSFCWAMYLRLLRRFVEVGEIVPYADRLDV